MVKYLISKLLTSIFLINVSIKSVILQYCNSTPIDPSIITLPPPDLPDLFETRLEVNYNNQFSFSQFLSYDYKNRRAYVSVRELSDYEFSYIYDYDNNELHEIKYKFNRTTHSKEFDKCKTYQLDSTPILNKIFGVNKINGTLVPNTVYEVLKFDKNSQVYNGTYIIRGIPSDAYVSCQYSSEFQTNFTAINYFSRYDYPMPFNNLVYNREPVRTIIKGVRMSEKNQLVNFEETYDFYEFKANYSEPRHFQTPESIFCEKRKVTKDLPKTPNRFTFSEETTINGITTYIKHFIYDENLQAVRYEITNYRPTETTYNSTDPFLFIHDYNVGVSFGMNKKTKQCYIKSLGSSSIVTFDTNLNLNNSNFNDNDWFAFKLKSPESILLLDSSYIYIGKRLVNNILCDIYMSNRSTDSDTIYTEFAFADKEFVYMDSFKNDTQIPVNLNIKYDNGNSHTSFYDYESDSLYKYTYAFDVSECFPEYQRLEFAMRFSYKDKLKFEDLNENLLTWFVDMALIKYTNESFTRFSRPKVSVGTDGYILIRSSILPEPPALSLFSLIPGNFMDVQPIQVIFNLTLDECAEYCLIEKLCLSFDYIESYCRLNPTHISEQETKPGNQINHYSKNIHNKYESKSTNAIYYQLDQLVEDNRFQLSIFLENNKVIDLLADEFKIVFEDDERYGTTAILNKYQLKLPNRKFSENNYISILNSNIDDCAKSCMDSLSFECKSFEFCYLNGQCRLNSDRVNPNSQNQYVIANDCDIYEQDELFHYKEFPYKASINKKDIRFKDIQNPGECANKCDNQLDVHCRSFNYCPSTKDCYLSSRHLLDMVDNESESDYICTHYSRDYLSDYLFTSNQTISLDHSLIYDGASVEQCSLLCTTADGFYCQGFYYCSSSRKCALVNEAANLILNQTISTTNIINENCANYKREYNYVTDLNKNEKTEKDNSNGILIGLSVSFSLIGLLFGYVGTIFVKQKL